MKILLLQNKRDILPGSFDSSAKLSLGHSPFSQQKSHILTQVRTALNHCSAAQYFGAKQLGWQPSP